MSVLHKAVRILPRSLYIEPISACNLHCKMCYTNVINGAARKLLDAEVILDFARRFLAVTPPQVWIYWCGTGEVFLHREFPRLVNRLLADYPDEVLTQTIQTNGTIKRLRDFDTLTRLDFNVSIDGTRAYHEWHRGKNTYDRTLDFCREAVELGCRSLSVRTLLTRDNIGCLDELAEDLRTRVGPKVELRLSVPYTNRVLQGVRSTALAINQQDIEDQTALTRAEALPLLEEKYQDRYALDEHPDAVDNYLSLTTYGVFSCCHGIINLGGPETDVRTLQERMAAAEVDCLSCSMFPCM
jgi:MoaA/NifB/PqqE/SkfB family radical SAM enzyme